MQRNGVTVGIPAYNEARHIQAAIRSAAPQCERLVVADNASTDCTADLCDALRGEFPHLLVVRQPQNRGALENFRTVLDRADTPYFMWLGGHDALPPNYVASLREALAGDPGAVLAFGDARHVDPADAPTGWYRYAYGPKLSDPDPLRRMGALVAHLSDCSLVHGLFRTDLLRAEWEQGQYRGADQVLLTRLARRGRLLHVPATHLIRRDVHLQDTAAAQLERIVGETRSDGHTLREMQQRLQALVREASHGRGWQGLRARLRARLTLLRRYGPFGASPTGRAIDALLLALLRAARAARRLVAGPRTTR